VDASQVSAAEAAASSERWLASWRALDLEPPAGGYGSLMERYGEAHRAYHTRRHLGECFQLLDLVPGHAVHHGEVELALWYHDAVYRPGRSDNERASAALAAADLARAGAAADTAGRVEALILWTAHDAEPSAGDAALLVDVDLGILGASPRRFLEYERQIRSEYRFVPFGRYRMERARVLSALAARPHVYATPPLRDRLEERARSNLSAAIACLIGVVDDRLA
jgi:predicted metal-dependent HD superfamily phosphohydrolase